MGINCLLSFNALRWPTSKGQSVGGRRKRGYPPPHVSLALSAHVVLAEVAVTLKLNAPPVPTCAGKENLGAATARKTQRELSRPQRRHVGSCSNQIRPQTTRSDDVSGLTRKAAVMWEKIIVSGIIV